MTFKTAIHNQENIFEELYNEWHALLENAGTNSFFQTPEFLSSWWQTLGEGKLQIVTVRDADQNGQLLGIAPLYVFTNSKGQQQLSFVGCVAVSDYLDFIVHQEHERAVYKELLETLLSPEFAEWEQLFFCSLPEESPSRGALEYFFEDHLARQDQLPDAGIFAFKEKKQDVSPLLTLPESWDQYLDSLDRGNRQEIKRKERNFKRKTSHSFELVQDRELLDQTVDDFIRLHELSSTEKKRFWTPDHRDFFRTLLETLTKAGWIKLYFLQVNQKRVAAMLVIDYQNTFYLYNSGYDAERYPNLSVGSVLTAHTIREAILLRRDRYDFLRGDEEYKFRFGADKQDVYDFSARVLKTG